MSISQREWDIMELESEIKIRRLLEEWQRGFLGSRLPKAPEAVPEEMSIEQDVIDTSEDIY